MLWTLIKILGFVAAVTGLTWGAGRLSELEGGAAITVAGLEITFSPLESAVALILFAAVVWGVVRLLGLGFAFLRFLNGDETAITRYMNRNRERKGFEALSEGMMALASGEGTLALAKASKAERYLERPDLTTLLTAQAAELAGDRDRAAEAYKRLLVDDRTRFVGIRGLMKQQLDAGNTETALKLAEKAFALKPRHEETQDVLLKLQAGQGDWTGARKTLGAKLRFGNLPRDVHRRRDAILALSEAQGVLAEGASVEAREAAIEANRTSPDLIPAAALAARAYIDAENPKAAARVLIKAWGAQPHPDLAAAFAEIAPDETPKSRLKRFETLFKANADHAETRRARAELLIAAEDFPEALRVIKPLVEADAPDARVLTIMAAVERGQGADDQTVRAWLARALLAPRGPQWVCDACGQPHPEWSPICPACGAFDSLSWKTPDRPEATIPPESAMLPLIIGTPKPTPEPEAEATAEPAKPEPPRKPVFVSEDEVPRPPDALG